MSRRVHPAFRKLYGLAAAPGRTLSALEPESRVRPVLSAEPAAVEDGLHERLAPLLAPASVAQRLERTLTKLGTEEMDGDTVQPRVRRGETVSTVERPSLETVKRGRPVVREPRAQDVRRADSSVREAVPKQGVDLPRLQEMAGLGVETPSRSESARTIAKPGVREPAGREEPRLPSREEVRARLEQRARIVGATAALETPVVALSQESAREVTEVLSRSLAPAAAVVGREAATRDTAPAASLASPLERALERLDARPPARSRVSASTSQSSPESMETPVSPAFDTGDAPTRGAEPRGGLAGLAARADANRAGAARAEEARNTLTGLAGLAARAASSAAPVPRARTESHPPPPLLANSALPSPAVPSVLTERMEETKLTQRLERLLRREAERAGVSLEGLDP
ncbi:hypothetical protein JY651_14515 [Pyxidicoccus parkwayensis]|uniref:Uncharacterized protein n=1 Tax=Pyxidicoccus parkwayensis TaxID=2813578 RepID=A0ABX7P6H9_9BACT|nr:hypothetical protein [Pyxidicoccus parkwaysis]QSQ26058.1 hypothetical protein JY651_14515 [Pyxidicoccus parkwaysis]